MRTCSIFSLVILTSFGLTLASLAAEHTTQSLAQIKQQIDDQKAVLVDVRESKEWKAGHIEGAVLLPTSSIRDGLTSDELKPLPKDKILYVHCVVGQRALLAANALEKLGYKVRPMKPGYKEMISAGFSKANP